MRSYRLLEIGIQYDSYCRQFYGFHEEYNKLSYDELYNLIIHDGCGISDFIHRHLKDMGIESKVVFYNNKNLQRRWRTDCADRSLFEILLMQIKEYKPDVILVSCMGWFDEEQIKIIKTILLPKHIKLVGFHFALIDDNLKRVCSMYDQIYTGSNCYVDYFKSLDLPAYLLHHAFETSLVGKMSTICKINEVCFAGSIIFGMHNDRFDMLNGLSENDIPYTFYGDVSGRIEDLMLDENIRYLRMLNNIRSNLKKPVYGIEYYATLNMYKVCVNSHGTDVNNPVLNHSGCNMRMFEATGMGMCLLTDYKDDNAELFDADKEIVVYKSIGEMVDKAKWLLENPKIAEEIALAGQRRTFRDYNYRCKAEQLNEYIQELLK